MNSEQLAGLSGVILQLIFEYLPGVSGWFDGLTAVTKRLSMAGLMAIIAIAVYFIGCYTPYSWVACDTSGIWMLVEAWVAALVANQAAHLVFKKA